MNPSAMTAAHRSLPFGTKLKVTNTNNGKAVVVRINDRGPFIRGRVLDLSKAAARQLGFVDSGHTAVCMARV
jgi:rare lipoprotein A